MTNTYDSKFLTTKLPYINITVRNGIRAIFLSAFAFLLLLLTVSAPLLAQNKAPGLWGDMTFSGNATLVSDYRFRGLSFSDQDPAIQGSFNVNHSSGFYVGTWASSIENFQGSELELDIYGGYTNTVDGLTYNVGLYAYTFPGATGATDYLEAFGSLGGNVGPVGWTVGSNYTFSNDATGNNDNIYAYLYTSTPIKDTKFSFNANIGYEDGAFGNNKVDWLVGLTYNFNNTYSLGLSYIDTANSGSANGGATVVAGLNASF